MKTSLLKKLFAVTTASVTIIINADAQIVYTDVNPDTTVLANVPHGSVYNLDLNNDGVNDFILSARYHVTNRDYCGGLFDASVKITPFNSNKVAADKFVNRLVTNAIINNQRAYYTKANQVLDSSWCHFSFESGCSSFYSGEWYTKADGYIGLKLFVGSDNYYGWVHVTEINHNLIIKDYAYNSTPNQPILAGEKSCTSPSVSLSANGPLSFCSGDSVTLTAKGTGYEYQWKQNGTNIPGATSKKYVAKTAGVYKCKVTNSCGSKTSKADTVTISCKGIFNNTAVSDEKIISKTIQLLIAPNPFSNSTNISFSLPKSQKVSISIFDLNGRLMKILADAQMQAGTHQLTWNANDEKGNAVAAGIYVLKLKAGNDIETKKISVIK